MHANSMASRCTPTRWLEDSECLFNRSAQAAGPGSRIEGLMLGCWVICLWTRCRRCFALPWKTLASQSKTLRSVTFVVLGRLVAVNMCFVFCLRRPFAWGVKNRTELCHFLLWLGSSYSGQGERTNTKNMTNIVPKYIKQLWKINTKIIKKVFLPTCSVFAIR